MNFKRRPPRLHRFLSRIGYLFVHVWEGFVRLLEGIERFIAWLAFQCGRMGRGIAEAVLPERVLKGFAKRIAHVRDFVGTIGQYLLPWTLLTKIGRMLDRLWNRAGWLAARFLGTIAALFNRIVPPTFRRRLSYLWIPFWRAGAAVIDFIQAWFRSRDYWRLLGALPALLLLLPLVICLGKTQFYSNRAKIRHYRQAAIAALDTEDYAKADLCYRKLAQLGQSERAEFEAALVKAAEGDLNAAYASIRKIAPRDQPGYLPAHFWIAQQLVQGRLDVPAEQRWEIAEKHIRHVLDRNPRDLNTQRLEALLFLSAGRPKQAILKLEQLVAQLPELRLPLAELYMRQGRSDEAVAEARRLLRFYDKEGGAKQVLQPHDYLIWASTAQALGQWELARQVVDKGLLISPGDQQLTSLSTQLDLISYDQATQAQAELSRRLELFGHALQQTPADPLVLKRLGLLVHELGVAHESLQEVVRPVVEAGGEGTSDGNPQPAGGESKENSAPHTANFQLVNLMGVLSHGQQEHARAVEYFERQVRDNPESAIAANNLAYELQFVHPTDLARAIKLANQAVDKEPENPAFHETRGQILVRLERWEEAVGDLEIAVNAMPGRPDIHGALATAYAQLGNHDLAQRHREQEGR